MHRVALVCPECEYEFEIFLHAEDVTEVDVAVCCRECTFNGDVSHFR